MGGGGGVMRMRIYVHMYNTFMSEKFVLCIVCTGTIPP